MPGVRDVRAEDFIAAYSSHLKRSGALDGGCYIASTTSKQWQCEGWGNGRESMGMGTIQRTGIQQQEVE